MIITYSNQSTCTKIFKHNKITSHFKIMTCDILSNLNNCQKPNYFKCSLQVQDILLFHDIASISITCYNPYRF